VNSIPEFQKETLGQADTAICVTTTSKVVSESRYHRTIRTYAIAMEAFTKTRRNRDGQVGGNGQQSQLAPTNQPVAYSIMSDEGEGTRSECAVGTSRCPSSPGYEGDDSQDDTQSGSSSPLSDYSFSSSDDQEDDSSYHDLGNIVDEPVSVPLGSYHSSPLCALGSDIMSQVLTFLDASEILDVLTMPLCRDWRKTYSLNEDLWKNMCVLEPFKANLVDDTDTDGEESFASIPVRPVLKDAIGEYRLIFTSFVRCFRYLERIQTDARDGRLPAANDNSQTGFPQFGISKSLKRFLHCHKDVSGSFVSAPFEATASMQTHPVGVTDNGYRKVRNLNCYKSYLFPEDSALILGCVCSQREPPSTDTVTKKPRFGNSMITSRLLGPSSKGAPSHLQLPRSCAIYSIVNWMVAHPEVEGIQVRFK